MAVVVHWFRRDLRLVDNTALNAAMVAGEVLPVFVVDPGILHRQDTGGRRFAFLCAGLEELDGELRRRGSRLLVQRGEPTAVLREICSRYRASAAFFNRDYEPYAVSRDERVSAGLRAVGVTVTSFKDDVVAELGELPGPRPFRVFTPFYRAWLTRSGAAAPAAEAGKGTFASAGGIDSQPLPTPAEGPPMQRGATAAPGHQVALATLDRFVQRKLAGYGVDRDRLDVTPSSGISPFLRFGMLSIRECLQAARRASGTGSDAWQRQLAWRDFYRQLLMGIPRLEHGPMDQRMSGLAWNDDPSALDAWRDGHTGYPVVDAAMRQLAEAGWLPNRARLIVASFLTKDLGLHWQLGERVFMERLVDGDLANNNGGWQWVAGCGADPQPFFRVFNPVLQGQRYDPEGIYVRRWCPELSGVPPDQIHAPWMMSDSEQRRSGCRIGRDYPAPIVDHQQARQAALARFAALRLTAAASAVAPRSHAGS